MSFASPLFLWYFLPTVLLASWLLPHRARNGVLAAFSLVFYAVGGKSFLFLLLSMMVLNYAAGLAIGHFRAASAAPEQAGHWPRPSSVVLISAVTGNVAALAVWKYAGFATSTLHSVTSALGIGPTPIVSLALPIGISFFTFHHLSYVIDVHRGVRQPLRNPLTFATYITMFPQLIAGPIVRYHEIVSQLQEQRRRKLDDFADGFPRFAWGLFKKVVIADSLAPLADAAFGTSNPTTATAWIGALAYTGQIYFDFSGYSDMAIGLARMFGLQLPENFNRPYSAISITDFWRRWHMSLSRWFRDYLYVPLGGNRGTTAQTYRNLVIVFLATGLWHGAAWTFVVWGAFHGFMIIIERFTGLAHSGDKQTLRRGATFVLVVVGWVIFRADTLPQAGRMLAAMLVPGGPIVTGWTLAPDVALLLTPDRLLLLGLVAALPFLPGTWVTGKAMDGIDGVADRLRTSARAVAVVLTPYTLLVAAAGSFSPFLYFQF